MLRVARPAKPRRWSSDIDPKTIPDGVLAGECARRIELMPEGPRKEARRMLLRELLVAMLPAGQVLQ